jgi:hypothetical protein
MTSIFELADGEGELLDVGEAAGVPVESMPHPINTIVEIRVTTNQPGLDLMDF